MASTHDIAAALIDAPDDAGIWRRFEALDDDARHEVVLALKADVDARVRSAPPSALPVAEALVRAAEHVPDLEPLALRGRALAAHFNGRSAAARADYERAIDLYEAHEMPLEAARVRRTLVDVLQMSGHSDEALACADAARAVFERHGESKLLAQLEVNVGNVFTRLDDYPGARRHYERARELFAGLDDALGLAFADFNLAVVELNANRCDEAETAWTSARRGLHDAGMSLHVADCDYSLAYLESRRGHYGAAIRGLRRAGETYRDNGKPSGPALCDLDLAEIYLRLDARRDAVDHARRAAGAFDALGMDYERARADVLAGLAEWRLGHARRAGEAWDRAAATFETLGNASAAAALQLHRGAAELAAGEASSARLRLRSARTLLSTHGLTLLSDLATVYLGRALLATDDAPGARRLLEELTSERSAGATFDILVAADALRALAEARFACGDEPGAVDALRRAVDAIERGYAQVPSSDVRIAFFRDRHEPFIELAWHLAKQHDPDGDAEALSLLERSRSRSLGEGARSRAAPSAEARRARERLDWLLSRRLDAEFGPAASDHELRGAGPDDEEIRAAQQRLARLTRAARVETPLPDATHFGADELAAARAPGERMVIYMTSAHGVRGFVVDDAGIVNRKLPIDRATLRRLRHRLWLHVDKLRLGPDYHARHDRRLLASVSALLDELGRRLVLPLLGDVDDAPLVVVPYGEMHDLPFHAFTVGDEPLVRRTEITYQLSVGHAARNRGRPPRPEGPVLATGLPGERLQEVPTELGRLAELWGDRLELVAPAELVATLPTKGAAGGMLHVASHGAFDPGNPAFSGLWLGESSLLAHDIDAMQLDLHLVTLSGCETGRKGRVEGDELFGLSRAFLGAGARATVGSLWAVDDRHTADFMSEFHGELAAGAPVNRAVAAAQRRLLDEHPHPWAWAGFALFGDPSVTFPRSLAAPLPQPSA